MADTEAGIHGRDPGPGRANGGTPVLPLTAPGAQEVVDLVHAAGLTVATAESCTGGLIAAYLAGAAGAGSAFRGGIVAYDARVKHDVLGVAEGPVVTAAAAAAMAAGARRTLGADLAVATSGVVGPAREEGQPVGTVFIAVAGPHGEATTHEVHLDGPPEVIRTQAVALALDALRAYLAG